MVESVVCTTSRARFQLVGNPKDKDLNWLFLPGGPGLGSESLRPLTDILKLPGNLRLLDLPGDGSNTTSNNAESFSKWPLALMEAISRFDHVVLVAHSTGGMYAFSLPKLESLLKRLVLIDSAPNAGWQTLFAEILSKLPIPGLDFLQERYAKDPNNQALKKLTLASAPYLFTKKGLASGMDSLRSLPYNYEACQWSQKHFDGTYEAKWVPKTIPQVTEH